MLLAKIALLKFLYYPPKNEHEWRILFTKILFKKIRFFLARKNGLKKNSQNLDRILVINNQIILKIEMQRIKLINKNGSHIEQYGSNIVMIFLRPHWQLSDMELNCFAAEILNLKRHKQKQKQKTKMTNQHQWQQHQQWTPSVERNMNARTKTMHVCKQ